MRRLVLGLALCAAITGISGCDKAEDGLVTEVGALSLFDPAAVNPSLCGAPAIPFPNNALFAATTATGVTTDTTLNIPSTASTAVAANLTDGWSTTASAFTDVLGAIDFASAANAILILEADGSPRMLQAGVDYTLQTSTALGQLSGTGGCALDPTVNTGAARFLPINQQRTRILIEPLKPLNPSTTYIVVVTRDLLSESGLPTLPNEFFPLVNSDTAICDRLGTDANLVDCSDPAAPADAAARLNAPALTTMTAPYPNPMGGAPLTGAAAAAARITTLETLRANLVRPTVLGFNQLRAALTLPTVADADMVIAWSFTTQSISASLATLNAIQTAKTFSVANAGVDTGDLGLADTANIFVGTLDAVPYYLDDAASPTDAASQLGFWLNNGTVTSAGSGGFVPWTPLGDYDANGGTPPTPAPCTTGVPPFNWVAPTSTTNCHRIPTTRSTENLPVMITVPKTAKPTNGWPVAIFQHGITGNRTQMLAIGPTLASAGFVTVSIDLPLHGVAPGASFYAGAGAERHFDLDLATNPSGSCLSAPAGDGQTDPSGTCFINLGSLITSRDNLRQAAADLIHVVKSLQAADPMNLDGAAGDDIDETQIHFVGISLGSIVGTTMLGVNTDVQAASISVPGGGLGKLLDASATFGPVIASGLAGSAFSGAGTSGVASPFEGTDTYETFVRFAQHLVDPGDPINYAVAANTNHPIHMTEVIGDTVVPNSAFTTCPATLAPGIGSTPAADNTLAATRDAACDAGITLVGTNSTTQAACNGGTLATGVCDSTGTPQDETLLSGYLSGTEPLYGQMGLTVLGPITPPTDCVTDSDATELDVVVQFAVGSHGSLLSPAASAAATTEMQRQTTNYLLSGGTDLDLLGGC